MRDAVRGCPRRARGRALDRDAAIRRDAHVDPARRCADRADLLGDRGRAVTAPDLPSGPGEEYCFDTSVGIDRPLGSRQPRCAELSGEAHAKNRETVLTGSAAIALVLHGASPAMADAAEDGGQGCRAGEIGANGSEGEVRRPQQVEARRHLLHLLGLFRVLGIEGGHRQQWLLDWNRAVTSADIDHAVTRGYCIPGWSRR